MKAIKRNTNERRNPPSVPNRAIAASAPEKPSESPPTTVELRGVQLHFPFKPYAMQEDYMGKVLDALHRSENALLESPTGTGKTLCLLCATLAWQREQARLLQQQDFSGQTSASAAASKKGARRVPTIIYASRTHSQLSQVVRELQNTRYRPKHAVLGSREQMCVNPKVKKATSTASEINHDCSKLGKERKCRYKNKLEGFQPPPNESGSFDGMQPVMDMEDLVTMGKQHKVCPFYYSRSQVEEAELVLVPYNYLFDKDSRSTTLADIPWDNTVIIFDEAHNLESFASESASFDLSTLDISRCIQEISRALGYVEAFPEHENKIKKDNILRLKSIFLGLEEYILNMNNQAAHRGEYMMDIFHKGASITHTNHELFILEVRKLVDIFLDVQGGTNSKGASGLEHFVQCVKRVYGEQTEARCLAKAQSYRVHITPKTNGNSNSYNKNSNDVGRTVSYWCFAPSEAMRELANLKVRSIIVTSGTLSPLQSYAMELDLPFPNRLENPHIVQDDQIHVRVVGKGVSGKVLSSSYERRQDNEYYTELGNTLVALSRVIPGGMLIFFPSYGVMQTCIERWGGPANSRPNGYGKPVGNFFAAKKSNTSSRYSFPHAPTAFNTSKETLTPWKRLLGNKAVVLEPRSTSDLPDAISEFHKFLNMPKSRGVALFGVCRGKISEGIDFAHDMCRAVVITGLPFAPSFDPKVKMKREFLDHNKAKKNMASIEDGGFGAKKSEDMSLSGHEWYTQQAHRAVNQAIGRVIRNMNDYGAILLLDSRFKLPGNQQGLSKWVRPHILQDEGMGRAISCLVKFYKQAAVNVEKRRQLQPPPARSPNKVSVILQYEEEGKENKDNIPDEEEVTKVAIIRTGDENKNLNSGSHPVRHEEAALGEYVPPEWIIARVDMKNSGSQKLPNLIHGQREHSQQKTSGETLASRPSIPQSPANKADEPSISVKFAGSANVTQKPMMGQSPAKEFFLQIQTCLTKEEFVAIKKAAVAMKQFKDVEHRKSFLKAARIIINIILEHESFENRSRDNKPELLFLFFKLLPKHYLVDCQRWAAYSLLQQSGFKESLESSLPLKELKKSRNDFVDILRGVWLEEDDKKGLPSAVFLKKFKEIAVPLVEADNTFGPEQLRVSLTILPLEYHASVDVLINALKDDLRASKKIKQVKEMEKRECGEKAVKSHLFRNTPLEQLKRADPNPSNDASDDSFGKSIGHSTPPTKGDAKPAASEVIKKRVNPYETKPAVEQKKVKHSVKALLERSGSVNPLQSAIDQSASQTFTGKSIGTHSMKSNAPKNFTCRLCEKLSEKPYISDCGHMACFSCWAQWLKKSQTCPICRQPTQRESLAMAVFKK